MERRRTNVAPASQQEISISITGRDPANSVQPLQNGLLEANIVHSTSSSSSIQTPDINSNSTQAPDSDTNQGGTSSQFNLPSLHLLQDKKLYSHKCVPLYKAALKGDCNEAKRILGDDHQSMLRAAVTKGYQTILHVATGAKQTNFVKQMVELTGHDNLLSLQDENGNTAFCFAAAVGSVEIAQFMLQRNPNLLTIRGGGQMTPLYIAALFGKSKMASFLYRQNEDNLEPDDLENTFFVSIETGLYGLALQLLKKNKKLLAGATHAKYGTAMHMLARNPSAFTSSCPGWLKVPGIKFITNNTDSSTQALELVKCLWKEISKSTHKDVLKLISKPSKLLFDAAHSGNFKFLAVLTRSYPDLVHQLDENGRSIFHIAVMHRHADTFKLIYEMGFDKELIATYVDVSGNNLLHLAAQYSNPKPISKVPGAALEMQKELKTFKEVETIVKPSFKEMKNNDGKTPWELFTDEHKTLLEEAEKWMKSRAESCSIVATLATAGVFQAAFTPPGGNKDGEGTPNFHSKIWFHIFLMSEAIAFSCSCISMLIFLSILITSRYRENDFLKRLPFKLTFGLLTLFIALATMMLSFSSSFFLAYRDRMNCFSMLTIILVFLPVALYLLLQCRLQGDILYSTSRSRFLVGPKY
ncbi:ANK REP REGION domain-containing protein [Citrus sinensis]|nr:ANK REP REGION domain-containing protein [Citrus sinensis]